MLRPGAFLSRTAVRLALEAGVIVAAAVAVSLNDPTLGRVIAVMVPIFLLVAGAEWFISKRLREGESEPVPGAEAPPHAPQPEGVGVVSPSARSELVPVTASADGSSDGAPNGVPNAATPAPSPEPEPHRPPLVAVPAPVPVAEPAAPAEVAVAAEPSDDETVVQFPARGPRVWNLWDLERLSRQYAGRDSLRDEERAYLLVYLREFANADGELPIDFDGLVRESFGDLVTTG